MSFSSIGDLASKLMLTQSNQQAKSNMLRLSQELTTGLTSDVGSALRNDFSIQASWERSINTSQVREKTLTEAMTRVQVKQSVLSSINNNAGILANNMSLAIAAGATSGLDAVSTNAKDTLGQMLSELNTQTAGRTLFSGSQINSSAMADMETILASVSAAVFGASTVDDITVAVQSWMEDPNNGFATIAYLGDSENAGTIRLGEGRILTDTTRADNPALKQTLQNLILGSLVADDDLSLSRESKSLLLESAANGLRAAGSAITNLQASLGYFEGEISEGIAQAGAEITTAQMLRTDTLGVDQYEAASKLQEAELQLEKIYLLTSRTAQMSLLEYL